jgi:SAM-dependent methyltransferase
MTGHQKERWASGDLYEPYVGRWSRLVARDFLAWLDAPAGLDWLDVGCGTGALAEAVAHNYAPRRLAGIDPSEGFLAFARQRLPAADLRQASAGDLPFATATFDRVVSGLVLNFVPDAAQAAAEMARVARPGGEVAIYLWDYADKMEMMRTFWDAAIALDPAAIEKDEGRRFPLCRPEPLRRLFEGAGLDGIEGRTVDVPTVFRDFDDFWTPFLSGQAPAPTYCMSLDDAARGRLRERLRQSLPTRPDGSIGLIARAFAVRGRKP